MTNHIAWNFEDLTGKRFGKLVAEFVYSRDNGTYWTCVCDCGNKKRVAAPKLKSGNTKSCGCYRKEFIRAKKTTHGMSKKPIYKLWFGMKKRCENPKDPAYKNYGGRGIGVCGRWQDFKNFYADMGERPPKSELERIDNDKGYSPENCKWATRKEQANNRRSNKNITLEYEGVVQTHPISTWADIVGLQRGTVWARLSKLGWSEYDAVFKPHR